MPEAPTEYYTSRYSGEEIDRGVAGGLTMGGAETSQEALYNLGAGVRPSLLDNAIFVGGGGQNSLPINQVAGQPDRWRLQSGASVEINEDSITFANTTGQGDGYYWQAVPLSKINLGKKYTASALFLSGSALKYVEIVCHNSGSPGYQIFGGNTVNAAGISIVTFTVPINTTSVEFRFNVGPYGTVGSMEMVGGKLEEGKDQTLAYQDSDGNWQLLPQPDSKYSAQLFECQRYQITLSAGLVIPSTVIQTNYIDFFIPTPIQMRATPAVDTTTFAIVDNTTGSVYSDFSCAIVGSFSNGVAMRAIKASHGITSAGAFVNTAGMLNANL